ncbi:MAG: YciI family protein [Woeseiaceae bacterium]|jgi:uncharacterized protein|nr:YciI family protein [Woeseiaceae bacterium]MDG1016800.1 YciI family protein [Woeseiaceae bacterium]MDG1865654.1 YciI family protein [Woeseiaceae bacterium]
MWYVIIGEDIEGSLELRMSAREAHLDRLKALVNQGRILVGGPMPAIDSNDPGDAGFTGSVIIAEFDSLTAAQEWANEDPYVKTGVFKHVTVKPFKKVLP